MGKKTNWSPAEDLALCRAWLAAGDAVGHSAGYSRAATFWGVAHHIFHAELETAVERGHNGLKIRWTRINRDVQKFATIVQELQDQHRSSNNTAGGNSEGGEDVEQQRVEDAKERFFKQYDGKFHFEACWKLLRLSPKWTQLLASAASTGAATASATPPLTTEVAAALAKNVAAASVVAAATAALAAASTPSAPPPTQPSLAMETMVRLEDAAEASAAVGSTSIRNNNTSISNDSNNVSNSSSNNGSNDSNANRLHDNIISNTINSVSNITSHDNSNGNSTVSSSSITSTSGNGNPNGGEIPRKRRATTYLPELPERGPTQQLQEVTSCLVDEMRRRNELLEDQNAIALFRLKADEIEDEAREYFELLRRRYMKRMRAAVERSSSSGVQNRSGTRIETSSAAPAVTEDDSLTASEGEGEDVSKRVPQTHDLQHGRESADGGAQTATSAV